MKRTDGKYQVLYTICIALEVDFDLTDPSQVLYVELPP